ncbi:MAG: hypothetical protein ACO1TE_21405 [Prosthecobacter sp.]
MNRVPIAIQVLVCCLSGLAAVASAEENPIIDFAAMAKDGLTVQAAEGGSIIRSAKKGLDIHIEHEAGKKLDITQEGLGWDFKAGYSRVDAASCIYATFMTPPMGVGRAWRPKRDVSLMGRISLSRRPVSPGEEPRRPTWISQIFVRHSPDKKHWSTWHPVLNVRLPKTEDAFLGFDCSLDVPGMEQREYGDLLEAYQKLDVPWRDDEEAAVRWILTQQPDFFAKHVPFIGHVQFLFEVAFAAGHRITSFDWGVTNDFRSGLFEPPKNPADFDKSQGPWRFDATEPVKK